VLAMIVFEAIIDSLTFTYQLVYKNNF